MGAATLQRGYAAKTAGDVDRAQAAFEDALSTFKGARAADPSLAEAHLGVARAQFALGRFDQARSSFDRVRRMDEENADAHWGSALALLQLDRRDEAMERVRRVTELEPGFESAWLVLSGFLSDRGDERGSVGVLDRALKANPTSPGIAVEYGSRLQAVGELAKALDQYELATRLAQGSEEIGNRVRAELRAGALLIELDRADEGLGHLKAVVELSEDLVADDRPPIVAAALYGAGLCLARLKRYDEAIEHLEHARQEHGSMSLLALTAQVTVLRGRGRYATAWKLLSDASAASEESLRAGGLQRTDPDYAFTYGEALRLLGDRPKAVGVYREAIGANPNDAALRAELIATYLELRDEAGAAPETRTPHIDRSRAGHYGEARNEFARTELLYRDALEANRSPRNLVSLGGLLMLFGHDDAARPLLLEAIRGGRQQGVAGFVQEHAHAYLAMAYARSGDHARAVREFEAALCYDPDEFLYQVGSAEAHLRLGRLEVAERLYRSVLEVAPDSVEARIGLAETLTAQGDAGQPGRYELAISQFDEAIRLADATGASVPGLREGSTSLSARKLATLHYETGYAYAKLYEAETARGTLGREGPRHLTGAVQQFEKALKTDPGHPQSAAAIDRIKQEQRQHRSREIFGTWIPAVLAGICLLLIVVVHVLFFVSPVRNGLAPSFREQLQPSTYGLLVFGLLVFLIAAVSLPQLLKLKVAGVALEKAAVEQTRAPAHLEILREPALGSLVPIKLSYRLVLETRTTQVHVSEGVDIEPKVEPAGGRAAFDDARQRPSFRADAPEREGAGPGVKPADSASRAQEEDAGEQSRNGQADEP